ncbi:hypothetical protein [Streptomyces sp. NPDC012888]|uniref:hypothetical protein n=1 Tax=Streptomyces sp. NPDC012888 TaxID=3364855 RepID=UPI0036AA8C35
MTTPLNPIADLDRPLIELESAMETILHRRRLREGALAEQRHQVFDLDADSVCPFDGAAPYPYLTAGGAS